MARPLGVAFLLPHLRAGGAERAVLNWLGALDRARFRPMLLLGRVEGAFIDRLPPDILPISLGGRRALRLPHLIARTLAAHDVAVAYSATNAMNLALLAAPLGRRTARIISEHTPPHAYLAEAKLPVLRRAAMRLLYPRADAIAVPTQAIADELARLVRRALPTTVLRNPVIDGVQGRPLRRGLREGPARLVAAGRLVPAKGHDVLIDACALVAARGVPFRLAIFGDGALRGALAARIAAAGLAGTVELAGHSDRLGDVLARADLFVLASRREGFGNVVVEAMAAGTPVLATRSGGPEALIREGETGFLVPPEDAGALAEAIVALIADPDRRDRVREAALRTAAGYDVASSTRQFETLLEAAAASR